MKKIEYIFMNTCTVMNDTLTWDLQGNRDNARCLDIDPDTLYALPHVMEKFHDTSETQPLSAASF